jgi:hypothetical protein
VLVVGRIGVCRVGGPVYLDLEARLHSGRALVCVLEVHVTGEPCAHATHMSNGYTNAFAITAPAEPAMALPHGGIASTFEAPAIDYELRENTDEYGGSRKNYGSLGRGRCGVL